MFVQGLLQTLAGVLLIIDDQDAWNHGAFDTSAVRMVNGK
jgi:hypothetical protein